MKKVLIITYYWPPCGGIGVLRCLKFAKYLRSYGWEPIIFTAENAHYPSIDHSNDGDIPEGITVLRQKIWEPYHFYKLLTGQKKDANVNNVFYASEKKKGVLHNLSVWIRSNFFIPDARALWVKPSVKYLKSYLKEHPVDAMISNGPPHSNTRIATLLKKETGIPWLADFQDPWSQVDYFSMLHLTHWGKKKHLAMEQEVFQRADAISIVSKTWKKDLESIGAKDVQILPWGFDNDDFKDLERNTDEKFTITHIGILGNDRQPDALILALKRLMKEDSSLKDHLKLQLVGLVDKGVMEYIRQEGLENMAVYPGSVDRKRALQYALNSHVLLLMLNNQENAEGRIPGKLFEYLATKNPILAIGPENSDVKDILLQTSSGYYNGFDDTDTCYVHIKKLFNHYLTQPFKPLDVKNLASYSNEFITGEIAKILNKMTKK